MDNEIRKGASGQVGGEYRDYVLQGCEPLAPLEEGNEKTVLVRDRATGALLVRKELPARQGKIYQQLLGIRHPNLAKVEQVFYQGEHCIVLEEFVSGQTLGEILEREGHLPLDLASEYLAQLLAGLEQIHQKQIIHRDVKPENLLISTDGVLKILDFGIARFVKEKQGHDTTTLGTVGYASPEQFGFRQTDMRTDLYAAGVLYNQMLTGKMPNELLPDNERAKRLILKSTELDPANRYGTAREMRNAMQSFGLWRERDMETVPLDLHWLPGFRTGVRWHKVLATAGYMVMLLLTYIYMGEAAPGGMLAIAIEAVAVFLYIWCAAFCAANFLRWDRRVPGIRRLPKELRIGVRIVASFIFFRLGMFLEDYVKLTMLGLSAS